jgi:hypothetical protein
MKEEEAKKRICPFINQFYGIEKSTNGTVKYQSEPIHCKGRDCMAWKNNECARLKIIV